MSNPAPGRMRVSLGILAFIAISLSFRLVPWWALSFLGEKSIVRHNSVGAISLVLVAILTAVLLRRFPTLLPSGYALVPRADLPTSKGFTFGFLSGAALFAAVFAGVVVLGGLSGFSLAIHGEEFAGTVTAIFVGTVLSAAWEEFTFRGWPFLAGVRVVGPHTVALGIGVIFGCVHVLNPNWTVAAVVSVCAAGWLLSYAMLVFRSIAVAIGLHVGWNFTQSMLTSKRLWAYSTDENSWLSGGEYGLEASAVGIVVTAVAAGVCLLWYLRSQREKRSNLAQQPMESEKQ
ncbi:MAG: hypothetical protein A2289_15940 [Deltaproteobacteria bacterium RIFOXYA12_FULL_58_15]|nr:MAG: hypothetical protein A2289_15940 [Deltaproteobacteria bacterium RIFOXYA12_FULL_58_15]